MSQTKPPYRAEHVGSLPRPVHLMGARGTVAPGPGSCPRQSLRISRMNAFAKRSPCRSGSASAQSPMASIESADGATVYDKCDGFGPETVSERFLFGCTTARRPRDPVNRK